MAQLPGHSRLVAELAAGRLTEADGRWPELRAELESLHDGRGSAGYLLASGEKRRSLPADVTTEGGS